MPDPNTSYAEDPNGRPGSSQLGNPSLLQGCGVQDYRALFLPSVGQLAPCRSICSVLIWCMQTQSLGTLASLPTHSHQTAIPTRNEFFSSWIWSRLGGDRD